MVTNIPAPYRLPVFEVLGADRDIDFRVFFCGRREPDRHWGRHAERFSHRYLNERFIAFRGRYIHINPDIWSALREFKPDAIVNTGFNPTHLLAFLYARIRGIKHVTMTDGTYQSEGNLTAMHRWIRRRVFAGTESFIGASAGSLQLYRSYGVEDGRLFKSPLCVDNDAFAEAECREKKHDFIFCGQFIARKNPLFALAVAQGTARKIGRRVSIVCVGSGGLGEEMRATAAWMASEVDVVFPGFASWQELPAHYAAARIFLFPTLHDPWGVVANEACAAGLPVLVTPAAGAAHELIRSGENGFVMPLDLPRWIDASARLLADDGLYARFSVRSRELVSEYTCESAARGIRDAVLAAMENPERPRPYVAAC